MSTLREDALALYTPPFKFLHGYVFDSSNHMVADQGGISRDNTVEGAVALQIRGWGRIGYMPNASQLQDEIGTIVVDALNAYYAVQQAKPEQERGNTQCNPHPDAPHGFSRSGSLSAGRYVCDCEGWISDWGAA